MITNKYFWLVVTAVMLGATKMLVVKFNETGNLFYIFVGVFCLGCHIVNLLRVRAEVKREVEWKEANKESKRLFNIEKKRLKEKIDNLNLKNSG